MAAVDVFTSATNGQSNTIIGCSISVVQLHKLVDTAYDDHNLLPQPRKHKRKTLSTFIHPVLTWSTDYTSQLRSLCGTTAFFTWTWPLLQNDWWICSDHVLVSQSLAYKTTWSRAVSRTLSLWSNASYLPMRYLPLPALQKPQQTWLHL